MALIFDCSVREHPTIVRLVHQRRAVIVHLNWVCIFLGFLFARGSRLVPDKARLGLVRVVEARVISLPSMGCISPSSGC